MKAWLCAPLIVWSLLMGCEPEPRESWKDKDADFLIAKLESRNPVTRSRAAWNLKDKIRERNRVIAALTDTLLNDTHERVRSETAQALKYMTPPAAEALSALIEALNLPADDRGKPIGWSLVLDVAPLHVQAEWALEEIGTPEALKAINEFKKSVPTLIESSVPDGTTDVDAGFINKNGIALRFSANTSSSCRMLSAGGNTMWRRSFKTNAATLKPWLGDRKLVNGTDYTLECSITDDWDRHSKITITFSTKP